MKFIFFAPLVTADKANLQEPCGIHDDCVSNFCSTVNNNICMEQKSNGRNCLENAECESGRCSILNVAQCMPKLPDETRCVLNEDCESNFCSWQDDMGTCRAQVGRGGSCLFNGDCTTGWCSSWHLMKCRDRLDDGELCVDSAQCQSGWCSIGNGSSCSSKKDDEIGCFFNNECQSSYCEYSLFRGPKCTNMAALTALIDAPLVDGEAADKCGEWPAADPENGQALVCGYAGGKDDKLMVCQVTCNEGYEWPSSNGHAWICDKEVHGWGTPECTPKVAALVPHKNLGKK